MCCVNFSFQMASGQIVHVHVSQKYITQEHVFRLFHSVNLYVADQQVSDRMRSAKLRLSSLPVHIRLSSAQSDLYC